MAKHSELAHNERNDLPRFSPPLSPIYFLCFSRFSLDLGSLSSRAAFRMFGRALNWTPFKTCELFNAPRRVTPPPFVISPLSRVLRDSSYERARRKMSHRRRYIMIIYKVLTRPSLIFPGCSVRTCLFDISSRTSFVRGALLSAIIINSFPYIRTRALDGSFPMFSSMYAFLFATRYYVHFGIYRNYQKT